MQCPNPACKRDTFNVRVVRKENVPGIPMMSVELTCTHCGHKIKAWVTNQNLKDIDSDLDAIMKSLKSSNETLEEILENIDARTRRKGFFDSIRGWLKL